MSIPTNPDKALLFLSLIYHPEQDLSDAVSKLVDAFGPLAYKTEELDFDMTDYYNAEMGKGLKRVFLGFEKLVERDDLPEIKTISLLIERSFMQDGKRRINFDPGLLTQENIVLSTCKNYSHRIYLGKGVFAEVTLMYSDGDYRPLEWTYPDYASKDVRKILNEMREKYKEALR